MRTLDMVVAGGVLLMLIALAFISQGCGASGLEDARRAIAISEQTVLDASRTATPLYVSAGDRALQASNTATEYRAAMQPWDRLEESVRAAQHALIAAHDAIDAWDDGGASRWPSLAACVADAIGQVLEGLRAVGVDPPPVISQAVGLAGAAAGGTSCQEGRP